LHGAASAPAELFAGASPNEMPRFVLVPAEPTELVLAAADHVVAALAALNERPAFGTRSSVVGFAPLFIK